MTNAVRVSTLSIDQLREFLEVSDTLDVLWSELANEIAQSVDASAKFGSPLFGWGAFYELSHKEHLSVVLLHSGILPQLQRAAKQANPNAAFLSLARDELPEELSLTEDENRTYVQSVGFALSLRNSIRAVGLFGKWINELIADAKRGNDLSLFQAVSVDPCVTGSPYFQHRLALALFLQDHAFLDAYRQSLRGPTKKISKQICRVRLAGKILVDDGGMPTANAELVDLFCNKLKIYPSTGEPAKALRKVLKVILPASTT